MCDFGDKVQGQILVFPCKCIYSTLRRSNLHMSHNVESDGQILYFLVNASTLQPLNLATLHVHRSNGLEGATMLGNIL